MMTSCNEQKLPLDIQAFEIMRGENYLYVDKTRHVYQMAAGGRYYFLSRPRRFGKSLLVSTLKCLFQGRKELFEGLWIAEHGDWEWQEHPVVTIDFSEIANETPQRLQSALQTALARQAEKYQLGLDGPFLQAQFGGLVLNLFQKTKMPVVVLIDEYDKPIIDHLGKDPETAKANRDVLKRFFGVLKSGELAPILRFVFLTGITRFSKVSIFSELNNLRDLSMLEPYADLLGWTQQEVEHAFGAYIDRLAQKFGMSRQDALGTLADQYNGYRFSEKDVRVYNPFSLLNAFANLDIEDYWFENATPTFLIHLLTQVRYPLPAIEGLQVSRSVFNTFDLDFLRPEALLFQTGYVTISDVQRRIYTLDYPNHEVKRAFAESLFLALTEGSSPETSSQVLHLSDYLKQEDFDAFFETVQAIFASIPYDLESKRDEAYFHTIFYLILSATGVEAQSSVLTCKGKLNLAVRIAEKVYIFEFKCNQRAEAAIQQIRDKQYADRYRGSGVSIFLLGINFSTETRNVAEWEVRKEA